MLIKLHPSLLFLVLVADSFIAALFFTKKKNVPRSLPGNLGQYTDQECGEFLAKVVEFRNSLRFGQPSELKISSNEVNIVFNEIHSNYVKRPIKEKLLHAIEYFDIRDNCVILNTAYPFLLLNFEPATIEAVLEFKLVSGEVLEFKNAVTISNVQAMNSSNTLVNKDAASSLIHIILTFPEVPVDSSSLNGLSRIQCQQLAKPILQNLKQVQVTGNEIILRS
jgi:hypothetical protein